MEGNKEWPWNTCEVCGRDYQRPKGFCPYCRKQKLWDEKTMAQRVPVLSPRLLSEIKKHKNYSFPTHPASSMFLTGPAGTGKTVFAAKVLHDLMEDNYINGVFVRPQFLTIDQLTDEIRACYDQKKSDLPVIQKYKDCDWLFLDDFGAKATNDWVYSILYSIINYRYEQLKPLVVISNLSLEEIAQNLQDERLTRRVKEMSEVVYRFEK